MRPSVDGLFEAALVLAAGLCFIVGYGDHGPVPRPFAFRPASDEFLRIATWNVGGSDSGGHALRDEDLAHVVSVLKLLEPDLCLLQELEDRLQLRALRRELGPGWSDAIARGASGRRLGALARGADLRTFGVEGPAGKVLGLELSSERWGELTVVGLHADAYSSAERNAAIGAAAEALWSHPAGGPRILAGDLNLDLDLGKRRDLFSDDEYRDVETYNYVAGRMVDLASGRGSTAEPDRRLDYIFAAAQGLEVEEAGPWKGQRTGDMDHDPVVADLVLSTRSP